MKNVIITGANGNLGAAVTNRFLSSGYHITATVGHKTAIKEMPRHENLEVRLVDLTDEAAADRFVSDTISNRGRIDAALLLVGGFAAGDIAATKGDLLRKQFSLNFETAFFMTRPLLPHMLEKGYGRLVFIGARPALVPQQGKDMLAYSLSKSLLFRLAESINEMAKGVNITASVVVPSTLDTALNRKSMPESDPSKWVSPEQVAGLLELIISDAGDSLRETVLKVYNNA